MQDFNCFIEYESSARLWFWGSLAGGEIISEFEAIESSSLLVGLDAVFQKLNERERGRRGWDLEYTLENVLSYGRLWSIESSWREPRVVVDQPEAPWNSGWTQSLLVLFADPSSPLPPTSITENIKYAIAGLKSGAERKFANWNPDDTHALAAGERISRSKNFSQLFELVLMICRIDCFSAKLRRWTEIKLWKIILVTASRS